MSVLNNSLLLGQEGGAGYVVERSLRFSSIDSAFLSRTPASAGNRKTWTWAGWVKRSKSNIRQALFSAHDGGAGTYTTIEFEADNLCLFYGGTIGGPRTSAVFRDPSAWFHVCVALDTTQSTASDRVKLYVNGTQQVVGSGTYPSLNADLKVNQALEHNIGMDGGYDYFSGYLADIHFIDGQALTPSSFTEVSATTGQLVPIAYSGTYGTNGFHLPFSDNSTAAALGTDTSGNGNTWTVNNLIAGPPTTSNSWSGYFNGSSATPMYVGDNNAFTFDSDFTVEAWVKPTSTSAFQIITSKWDVGGQEWLLAVGSGGTAEFHWAPYSAGGPAIQSSAGAIASGVWSHIAAVRSSGTITLYVNGISVGTRVEGSAGTNQSTLVTVGYLQYLGGDKLTGYISNLRIVKGTAVYTGSFTVPTSPLTAVTNTSLLTLQDSTFIDNSTNGFAITTNGVTISLDSPFEESVDTDSLVDTPTSYGTDTGAGGEVRGNYATLNPLGSPWTLSNGNLDCVARTSPALGYVASTIYVNSGKWYAEFLLTNVATYRPQIGVVKVDDPQSYIGSPVSSGLGWEPDTDRKYQSGTATSSYYGQTFTGDILVGLALDMDAGTLSLSVNGSNLGQLGSGLSGYYTFAVGDIISAAIPRATANFGQRQWAYAAPAGFKALCDTNLPAPVVAKSSDYFQTVLYTGNGSTQTISGLGFSPDLVWYKYRAGAAGGSHLWFDRIRTAGQALISNSTAAEQTISNALTAFNSDGFSLGDHSSSNYLNDQYVAWCWDAGTSTVTNTQGSITSSCRTNQSSGFSVVTFTSPTGTGNFSVGHGLNITPEFVIVKSRDAVGVWYVYHKSLATDYYLRLNGTNAAATDGVQWGAGMTSSVLGLRASYSTVSGATTVAYAWAPVAGYSSMGSFVGNGSNDGPFIYTGHSVRWLLLKNATTAADWYLFDSLRAADYNPRDKPLFPNGSYAEQGDSRPVDLLSNGFKIRFGTYNWFNGNGDTIIYCAFAQNPFQYARAR